MNAKLTQHQRILDCYRDSELERNRWDEGAEHHPKAVELMKHIMALDFELYGDSFHFKEGGDGDNGETLLYMLSTYFEMLDYRAKSKEVKP